MQQLVQCCFFTGFFLMVAEKAAAHVSDIAPNQMTHHDKETFCFKRMWQLCLLVSD